MAALIGFGSYQFCLRQAPAGHPAVKEATAFLSSTLIAIGSVLDAHVPWSRIEVIDPTPIRQTLFGIVLVVGAILTLA